MDRTIIRIGYLKMNAAIWWIEIIEEGTAGFKRLIQCNDENEDIYSDVFQINSEVKTHHIVERKYIW